jgi:thioredoxin-related protein
MFKSYIIILLSCISFPAMAQQPTANEVLKKAYRQAAAEHKNVFVMFSASWCVWCHKMDGSINDPEVHEFFQKNYVLTHLTIQESENNQDLENPGGRAIYTKYGGNNDQGIPYWLIFDPEGKLLADSQIMPGENCGCPATKKEVAYLIKVLKATSKITPSEEKAIEKVFRRNE